MTETQRRIRAYKRALPELRERVVAVALLLAMSASMLASASFAWVTLSTSPEVTGMATTVAANGNLEIALASGSSTGSAEEPAESGTRDSSATQGIVSSNTTWGNLINLSDPSYGISSIALRPALLNQNQRNKYPLYGAKYGEDGRVIGTSERYEFASYQNIAEDGQKETWAFAAGEKAQYGVRAITSVKYDEEVGNQVLEDYRVAIQTAYDNASNLYNGLFTGSIKLQHGQGTTTCVEALQNLVTKFAQEEINNSSYHPSDVDQYAKESCSEYIYDFYQMLVYLQTILEYEGEGLRQMANLQAYSKQSTEGNPTSETNTFPTLEALTGASAETLTANGVSINTLADFKNNYQTVKNCINQLVTQKDIAGYTNPTGTGIEAFKDVNDTNLPAVYYGGSGGVSNIVNTLADTNTLTIGGKTLNELMAQIRANPTSAFGMLSGNVIVIQKGILKDLEQRTILADKRLNEDMKITVRATLGITASLPISGTVSTAATGSPTYLTDFSKATEGGVAGQGDAVAKDTYGMAIDLWVRTNYSGAVLTLEGSVKTQSYHKQNSAGYYLYTYDVTVSDGENTGTNQVEVYLKEDKYYNSSNNEEVATEDLKNLTPVEGEKVIGYEGENRVWSEEALGELNKAGYLVEDNTTQGGGSCFVFYADSQPEQAKLLEMLESFTIAFLDAGGEELARAKLNTAQAFISTGKVTVPLEITSNNDPNASYQEGEDNETRKGITILNQNEATRITAIVYLDGNNLENENVLAAGELTGQLNIQFGTNSTLLPSTDEDLMMESRTITLQARDENGTTSPITYENYDENGHTITVELNVDGVAPDTVSGFFVRVISDTQGARQETVNFTEVADSNGLKWTADFSLKDPGTYVLSDLLVNGMQYTLDEGNQAKVTIPGLTLGTVTTNPGSGTYMTAEKSMSVNVRAEVKSDVGVPSRVTAHFYDKNDPASQISTILTHEGGSSSYWTGDAVFNRSGTFVLDSISVDGQSLDVNEKTTLTFRLGMTCRVYVKGNETQYIMDDNVQTTMQVKVWDDGGEAVTGLTDVKLLYSINNNTLLTTGAELTWNGDYYEGIMNLPQTGTYTFYSLQIGSTGTINAAQSAPTLTVRKDKPLALVEDALGNTAAAESYQYALPGAGDSSYATVTVNVDDSSITKATATLASDTGETITATLDHTESIGTGKDAYGKLHFHITRGGKWTLQSITAIREEETFILNPTQVTTTVVSGLTVTGNIDGTALDVTKALSGTFLQAHTVNLNLTVQDQSGNELPDALRSALKSVVWNGTYQTNTAQNYGSYTVSGSAPWDDSEVAFTDAAATVQRTVTYAGEYTTTITLNLEVNGKAFQYTNTPSPKLTVSSTKPEVKVTGVSPTNSTTNRMYITETPTDRDTHIRTFPFVASQTGDYAAMACVYFMEKQEPYDVNATVAKYPEVTLAMENVPDGFTGASMSFVGNGTSNHDTYQFTFGTNGTAKSSIGKADDGEYDYGIYIAGAKISKYPVIYPAGKMVQDQIVVTHNNATVTAKLANAITINNPLYPPYVNVTINDETYSGTKSYTLYSQDGETITLPTIDPWTTNEQTSVEGEFQVVGDPTTDTVHTVTSKTGKDLYKKYTRTLTTYRAESELTTWVNTHTLSKWNVNGTKYNPGETITLTGNANITAEILVTEGKKTTSKTTATYIHSAYTYVTETKAWSAPNDYGTKVDKAEDSDSPITYS